MKLTSGNVCGWLLLWVVRLILKLSCARPEAGEDGIEVDVGSGRGRGLAIEHGSGGSIAMVSIGRGIEGCIAGEREILESP